MRRFDIPSIIVPTLTTVRLDSSPDFQLSYAKKAWATERAAWRTVIQLNLLRSVTTILDVLTQEMSPDDPSTSTAVPTATANNTTADVDADSDDEDDRASVRTRASTSTNPKTASSSSRAPLQFTEKHRLLKLKLLPLRSVQDDLQNRLGLCDYPTPPTKQDSNAHSSNQRSHEMFVWSHVAWKSALRPGSSSGVAAGRRSTGGTSAPPAP